MSSTFQYDPLDILNKAEKSADDWWSNTLKNAKARAAFHRQHDEYVTGKREWLRIKGDEAYSPYHSVAEKRDELIAQRMDRYK